MELRNDTPFVLDRCVVLDKQAAEHLVVALKATYTIGASGELAVAEEQAALRPVEEFYGEPGKSGVRYEAELGPAKPSTDVVLIGSAVAPRAGTRTVDVSLRVGPVSKRVRVFGRRIWKSGIGAVRASDPEPFETIPLVYENAFGGIDRSAKDERHHEWEPRNPVGRGFRAKKSELVVANAELPNIQDADAPLRGPGDRLVPQGFGFVARDWQPRLGYAGTYDERWMEERMPLLPTDFDARFHNAAHPDLVAPAYLSGGEPVQVEGCRAAGRLAFKLPRVAPRTEARFSDRTEPLALALDTVVVDMETMELRLIWKGTLHVHGRFPRLREVRCSTERGQ